MPVGEAIKEPSEQRYSIQRLFTRVDFEVFYYNDTDEPRNNCDDLGPTFESRPSYHEITNDGSERSITWRIPVEDDSGVWRVVVVYNIPSGDEKRYSIGYLWIST